MEKHRRPRRGQGSSLDGMVGSGRTLGVPPRSYQPSRGRPTPTLGNFSQMTDGFHPAQGISRADRAEADEAQLLDEPIVLDHIEARQRKVRFWSRHLKLKKLIKRTAFAFMVIILAGGAYFGYKIYHTQKKVLAGGGKSVTVCSDNVDPSQLSKEGDSRINILLLGIGGPGHDGPDLTDTIMLASIDPIDNSAVLLSIPRDLWVKIPGYGQQKVNAAFANGKDYSKSKTEIGQTQDGIKLADEALQPVFDGVNIQFHVVLDFQAFQQMVDTLGGVSVNVPETLYDPTIAWQNHNNPVIATKGVHTFSGAQALLYARSRETSSDFARGQRQRLLIAAIKDKAFNAGTFANPIKVSSLLDSFGSNVYTDFDTTTIKCLYHQLQPIPSSSIQSADLVTPPNQLVTTGTINHLSVVQPLDGLYNYSAIHKYLHSILPDGLIKKENAPVAIYNATDRAGLATSEAALLKSYGYNVLKVDSTAASSNPPTTTLVDLSKGQDKYTLHYLESRFGVTATSKLPKDLGVTPPAAAKFVIILGNDVTNPTQ